MLDSALNGFLLTSKHGSEVPSESIWWNTLTCLSCLMSPWRRAEVAQYALEETETEAEWEKNVELFNALTAVTLKLLDTAVKFTSNPRYVVGALFSILWLILLMFRFPAHYTMALVTTLTQCTLLGVQSVASIGSSATSSSAAFFEPFSSFLLIWVKVRDVLCSVVESTVHYYDIDTRKW